jgi:hypothetical protein
LHSSPRNTPTATQPWPTDETGTLAAEATGLTTTPIDGAIVTGAENATTLAGATTARAITAGTEIATGTIAGIARAPGTGETAAAPDRPAAIGATIAVIQTETGTETGPPGGGGMIVRTPNGNAGIGA